MTIPIAYFAGACLYILFFSLFEKDDHPHVENHQPITPTEQIPTLTPMNTSTPLINTKDEADLHSPIKPLNTESTLLDIDVLEHDIKPILNETAWQFILEIDEILNYMREKISQSEDDVFKFELYDLKRTLTAYLYPALEAFQKLPSFLRHHQIPNIEQTPDQILEQELALISEEMKKIAESIFQNDLNRLIDHGQYLKQKLQSSASFKIRIDES